MPFKYVLIPASPNEPMQELEYEDIDCLEKDSFRPYVEQYFANIGGSVDRDVLLAQLKERTGTDLKKQLAEGKMDEGAMEKLMASTSVEIFPVMVPTKDNEFEGISVYLDDKGVAKNLEENPRMSGIVQACGYPGQTFRGDCFLGRVFDDTEDEWRRTSFPLSDCSTDAAWVAKCKKQRSKKSVGDMQSLAQKIGMKNNAANINPGMMEDTAPKGETEKYLWKQVEDEVEVTFKKEGLLKGDKKEVKVVFQKKHLRVEAKGETLIDADLFGPTHPDESTWTLSDGVLQVMLSKSNDDTWDSLLKDS
eukprot:TRINITY_DN10430_c0_g1_i1.p1 TRINITY_DN10430_c0_g1~~TRINITY_DN10430_c0_g1_i1.p1  ORF type:complete len:306 (-),score=107.20 TRINITY_DN10430_c0_g1_i1:306-1223(-)